MHLSGPFAFLLACAVVYVLILLWYGGRSRPMTMAEADLLVDRVRCSPSARQAGKSIRFPSVLPAVAMPTMVPKLTNGSNSLARSAAKPMATATLERRTPGPLTR